MGRQITQIAWVLQLCTCVADIGAQTPARNARLGVEPRRLISLNVRWEKRKA